MKKTERFENAVTKLYSAYHNNELIVSQCSKCAVGNICDNNGGWFLPVATARNMKENEWWSERVLHPVVEDVQDNDTIKKTGYSGNELAQIETLFATHTLPIENKETQFKGLCAVVEYLCELDGIPNVMDYSKLFETENDKPIHELSSVFL